MARGDGLRVRFSRKAGLTAKGQLSSALYLPVVIGEFTVSEDFPHQDYDTHRAGQFSVPAQGGRASRQLRATDLETMTLDWEAPWMVEWLPPQETKVELLELARSKSPFELVAVLRWGDPEELRMLATIRGITRTLKPGEADTRYWSLNVTEYRDGGVSRRAHGAGHRGVTLPTKHRLTATDTLEGLARRYYAGYTDWVLIARANGIRFGTWGATTIIVKHTRFDVGDFIKIPEGGDLDPYPSGAQEAFGGG